MSGGILLSLDKLADPHSGLGQFSLFLARTLLELAEDPSRYTLLVPRANSALVAGGGAKLVPLSPLRKEKAYRLVRWLGPLAPVPRGTFQLWHCLAQDGKYLPFDRDTPVLVTIHDLNYLRETSGRKLERRLATIQNRVDRASAIATDSEFSAAEIRTHLDLHGLEPQVIYPGAPPRAGAGEAGVERPAGIPSLPFLFGIGHVVARKNFHVLVPMMERLPGLALVIAGRRPGEYADAMLREAVRRGLADRVVLLGEVSEGARTWLYRECAGVVVPSLTEGFGLPVVEGMSWGKPVFMSRVTSLPEVAGELGWYWDGYDPEAMATVVRQGLERHGGEPKLAARLREHAARFTWRRAAEAYRDLYRMLLGG